MMTEAPSLSPTRAADGRTMIGHVVLCRSVRYDDDAVALWQVSTEGVNTGAWMLPSHEVFADKDAARHLLSACTGRAVIGWAPEDTIAILRQLEDVAGIAAIPWERFAIAIPEAMAEVADVRALYLKRVAEQSAVNKNIVDLEWTVDLPDPLPATESEMRRIARLKPSTWARPAAVEALLSCGLVRWTARRWQETTTALMRRDFLRQEFGDSRVLPPAWEQIVADAYEGAHPAG